MIKHTQTIRQQEPTNCLSLFEYFMLVLKWLKPIVTMVCWFWTLYYSFDFLLILFQPGVGFYIETSHLICRALNWFVVQIKWLVSIWNPTLLKFVKVSFLKTSVECCLRNHTSYFIIYNQFVRNSVHLNFFDNEKIIW